MKEKTMTSEQHRNADAKKKNSRLIGIGVIVFFVVGIIAIDAIDTKRKIPSSPGIHISDFAREKPAPQAIVPFEKNGRTYFGWIAELSTLDTITVVSGPAVYVFDKFGMMVDYTIDVGDDPSFKDNWEPLMTRFYDKENYISLEEVEARIAKKLLPENDSQEQQPGTQ